MTTGTDIHRFLVSKLEFVRVRKTGHDQYVLKGVTEPVKLPTRPTIPRHPGDLSQTVLKKTAAALGLTSRALAIGCKCHLSASCIWLCTAAHVLSTGLRSFESDNVVYRHTRTQASNTALATLELFHFKTPQWNAEERKVLKSVKEKDIDPFLRHEQECPAITRWLLTAGFEKGETSGEWS